MSRMQLQSAGPLLFAELAPCLFRQRSTQLREVPRPRRPVTRVGDRVIDAVQSDDRLAAELLIHVDSNRLNFFHAPTGAEVGARTHALHHPRARGLRHERAEVVSLEQRSHRQAVASIALTRRELEPPRDRRIRMARAGGQQHQEDNPQVDALHDPENTRPRRIHSMDA